MKMTVLMKNSQPIRVYYDPRRATEDYELVMGVQTEGDYFQIVEVEVFGSTEEPNVVEVKP